MLAWPQILKYSDVNVTLGLLCIDSNATTVNIESTTYTKLIGPFLHVFSCSCKMNERSANGKR